MIQDNSNNLNKSSEDNEETQHIEYEQIDPEDQERINEEIAQKFYGLSSSIKVCFDNTFSLIGKKQETRKGITGKKVYFVLNREEDDIFNQELTTVNENLGTARTILDSYITFSKSVPDFEKFFNKFYYIYKTFITNHRRTLFFRHNVEKEKYMYLYYEIHDGLQELGFLFARLCGTLNIGGDYIKSPPVTARPYQQGMLGLEGDRSYRPMDYYGDPWSQWRGMYNDQQDMLGRTKQRRYRDIGDSEDR